MGTFADAHRRVRDAGVWGAQPPKETSEGGRVGPPKVAI